MQFLEGRLAACSKATIEISNALSVGGAWKILVVGTLGEISHIRSSPVSELMQGDWLTSLQ